MGFFDLPVNSVPILKNVTSGILNSSSSDEKFLNFVPWDKGLFDSFMPAIEIDGDRFDKLYPYRLLVVEAVGEGYQVVNVNGSFSAISEIQLQNNLEGSWRMVYSPPSNNWQFTLPITPQQLSISSVFTTSTTPTLNGIVEEHNGVKFKMVTAQGSFGIWPFRENLTSFNPPGLGGQAIATLFGGTLQAAGNLINQVNRTINAATSNHPESPPEVKKLNQTSAKYGGTGYAHALLMDQFLEQYAELKKDPAKKTWRLAFDIPKQNQTFLVSPIQFQYFQSADSPNEYKFNLQLKAWRRINLLTKTGAVESQGVPLTTDVIRRILNTVTESRRTLSAVYNVIGAVNSDVTTIFNSIGEVAALLKQLIGLSVAVTDLPLAIRRNLQTQVIDAFNGLPAARDQAFKQTASNWKKIFESNQKLEGLAYGAVSGGALGISAAFAAKASVEVTTAQGQTENDVDVTDNITTDDLNLTPQQQVQIDNYLQSVLLLTTQDVIGILNQIADLQFQLSNLFNAGNDQYNQTFNQPPKQNRGYDTTIDEYLILKSLYDTIQQLQTLTATDQLDRSEDTSAIDFVQALAQQNNVPFNDQVSMVRAPVPFGLTIEQISARYLGDPDRWIEIATLNSLKEPYIDETGFTYDLLSNAIGRQFNLASRDNLYYGQKLTISAANQTTVIRSIIDIEEIAVNNYLITVDGEANLDSYTTSNQANVKGYLAGTVNSQNYIYIPSTLPVQPDLAIRPIPVTESDPLTTLSDVDLLLDDQYDIAIDQSGDFRLAYGMQNLIQALKLKLVTVQGSLIKHPEYGSGINVGQSSADISASQTLNQIVASVLSDDRFAGVDKVQVDVNPPRVTISLAVTLANGNGVFPLTFNLN